MEPPRDLAGSWPLADAFTTHLPSLPVGQVVALVLLLLSGTLKELGFQPPPTYLPRCNLRAHSAPKGGRPAHPQTPGGQATTSPPRVLQGVEATGVDSENVRQEAPEEESGLQLSLS